MLELRQNKSVKEREWENTPRESDFWGSVEKEWGKGKGPVQEVTRQR